MSMAVSLWMDQEVWHMIAEIQCEIHLKLKHTHMYIRLALLQRKLYSHTHQAITSSYFTLVIHY